MKRNKFITVMARLDDESQQILADMQAKLTSGGLVGTHTTDVPFHVSLGSFPTRDAESLLALSERLSADFKRFSFELVCFSDFGNRVLFLQPSDCPEIKTLHGFFDGNFADGLPFHPHVTLFCGDEQAVIKAKSILGKLPRPLRVEVDGLLVGEFFPTRLLAYYPFKSNVSSYFKKIDDKQSNKY